MAIKKKQAKPKVRAKNRFDTGGSVGDPYNTKNKPVIQPVPVVKGAYTTQPFTYGNYATPDTSASSGSNAAYNAGQLAAGFARGAQQAGQSVSTLGSGVGNTVGNASSAISQAISQPFLDARAGYYGGRVPVTPADAQPAAINAAPASASATTQNIQAPNSASTQAAPQTPAYMDPNRNGRAGAIAERAATRADQVQPIQSALPAGVTQLSGYVPSFGGPTTGPGANEVQLAQLRALNNDSSGSGGGSQSQALMARAQQLIEASLQPNDGSFRARMAAAVARHTGQNLLKQATDLYGTEQTGTNIGLTNQGALQRTNLTEAGANQRNAASEAGALQRTQLQGQNTLAAAQATGKNALQTEQFKAMLDAASPKTQAAIAYNEALTGNTLAQQQKNEMHDQLLNGYLTAAPGSQQEQLLRTKLTGFLGQTSPAQKAQLDSYVNALKDPTVPQDQKNAISAILTRMSGAGYAQGGMVTQPQLGAAIQPQPDTGALGMPDIHAQMQVVHDYRTYAAAAARLGATPVSFDQFSQLKLQTPAAQAPAPTPSGFAGGGYINPLYEEPSLGGFLQYELRGGRLPGEAKQTTQAVPQTPAQITAASPPGAGLQSGLDRQRQEIDRQTGYAAGGAIDVSGRQLLGPGTGKSDSIPAVIDGKTPAALSTGEFVMPVEAVRHFGLDRLNKMVEAARNNTGAVPKKALADGGAVSRTPLLPVKTTQFSPDLEAAYKNWVSVNKVPESNDYDMRGFYLGQLSGDPAATSGLNVSDGKLHFSDKWKLPNHPSFSNESMYSTGTQDPRWVANPAPYVPGTWAQQTPQGLQNIEIPRGQ